MDDYINILLESLNETLLSSLGYDYFLQRKRENAASDALIRTLSEEQRSLFNAYEEEYNACSSISANTLARRAFLLAREIYR